MNHDHPTPQLEADLRLLGLTFMAEQYSALATKAARDAVGHVDYLAGLTAGELKLRHDRATLRRIKSPLSDHQPTLRTGSHDYHVQPGLQAVAGDLQQRQHPDFGSS